MLLLWYVCAVRQPSTPCCVGVVGFLCFISLMRNYADNTAMWCSVCAVMSCSGCGAVMTCNIIHPSSSFAFLCDYWTWYINILQYRKCIWHVPFTWHLTEYSVMNYIFNVMLYFWGVGKKSGIVEIVQQCSSCTVTVAEHMNWVDTFEAKIYTLICVIFILEVGHLPQVLVELHLHFKLLEIFYMRLLVWGNTTISRKLFLLNCE